MDFVSSASIAALCVLALSQVGQSQRPSQLTASEKQVQERSTEEVQAFLHNDPEAMAKIWSDDMVVTNPLNQLVRKQDVLGMMKSGFLVITSYDRRIEYMHDYGDSVVVAGSETVIWGGKMPIAGKTQELRFTAVWRKQEGRWQEVVRHANIIPPPR